MSELGQGMPISQLDPIGSQTWSGAASALESYLGPMPQLSRVDPYEGRNVQFWTMPENYKGSSKFLGDTVKDLHFTDGLTYITRDILPISVTDEVTVQWTQFELNAHLMELNPYTTRAHAVTQKRNIMRAKLVRFGIEAECEADFLKTRLGRISFAGILRQFSNALKQTLHQDGMRALTMCHRQQNEWLKKAGIPQDKLFERYMQQDIERFAAVQKSKNGLEKIDMYIKEEMDMYGGEANVYLIPERIAMYARIAQDNKTDYYLAGPMGPARVNNTSPFGNQVAAGNTQGRLDGLDPIGMIAGAPTYVVKNKMIQGMSERETMNLARMRQIGNYYLMVDRPDRDYNNYKSRDRSILIYSQDVDDMVEIGLEQAIENAGIFENDPTGSVKAVGYTTNDSANYRRDQDEDFLTINWANPANPADPKLANRRGRRAIAYIGEINQQYLDRASALNAGRSVLAAFEKQNGALNGNALFQTDKAGVVTLLKPDDVAGKVEAFCKSLFGEINAQDFTGASGGLNAKQITFTGAYKNFAGLGAVTHKRPSDNADKSNLNNVMPADDVNSKIAPVFFETLKAPIPVAKRGEVQSIIDNTNASVQERGAMIRDKILGYIQDGVKGVRLQENEVHPWYEDKVQEYNKLVRESAPIQSKVGGSGVSKLVGYVRKGTDLSGTDLEYVENDSFTSVQNQYQSIGMMSGVDRVVPSKAVSLQAVTNEIIQLHQDSLQNSAESNIIKTLAFMYLMSPFNKQQMIKFVNHNILVPMNFIIFAPHMQYLTRAVIKCQSGGGCGRTFIGNDNFMISHESGRMMMQMHFTTHFRSVVTEAKNVYVQPDVFVQELDGGAGHRFWTPDAYRTKKFDDLRNSLICCALPITERHFDTIIDLTGRITQDYAVQPVLNPGDRLQYSTAGRYNSLYDFKNLSQGSIGTPMMTLNRTHYNTKCVQGHYQEFNPVAGVHNIIHVNKGHWGKDVYPGCAKVRAGALAQFESQNYSISKH